MQPTAEEINKAWRERALRNLARKQIVEESSDDPERHRDIEWEVEEKYGDGVRLVRR